MDGSFALLLVLLVGFIALGLAAAAGGVDSRELDPRSSSLSTFTEGE
jgi:hypothetical protein